MNLQGTSSQRTGFSLVEVLCAVLILGIALAGLTQGITTALSSSKESEVQSTAVMLAASVMETIRADGYVIEGSDDGEFAEPGLELYRWRQDITSSDVPGLYEVEVVIENNNTGEAIYELKTMLFDPPVSSASSTSSSPTDPRKKKRGDPP